MLPRWLFHVADARLHMAFLCSRALNGLRTYKYSPAGYTLLDDIHQPFWNCEITSCSEDSFYALA